jgi:hypothetical protein
MVDRTRKEFSDADIEKIAGTYHAWRGEEEAGAYEDVAGFCKATKLEEIKSHSYVLTPGRYVGAEDVEGDDVSFVERFAALRAKLEGQFGTATQLENDIRRKLERIGKRAGDQGEAWSVPCFSRPSFRRLRSRCNSPFCARFTVAAKYPPAPRVKCSLGLVETMAGAMVASCRCDYPSYTRRHSIGYTTGIH